VAGLSGRLARLEVAAAASRGPEQCRACGLRHVRPVTIALPRSIMVVRTDWCALALVAEAAPMPRLCLCDPCCGDPRERAIAELTHGIVPPGARREHRDGSG